VKSFSGIVALLGRLCMSVIFFTSAYSKIFGWDGNVQYVATRHFTNPILVDVMLGGALVIELIGGLCLVTGFQARIAAFVMALYLITVTVLFHNYWAFQAMQRATNFMHFQKNFGLVGGLLMVAALGPGPLAIGIRHGSR
jgi:putative oxidoreductase